MDDTAGRRAASSQEAQPVDPALVQPHDVPARPPLADEPLSDSELDVLATILANFRDSQAMGIEELDGFFAALNAGPAVPKPCQYWPVVLGSPVGDEKTLNLIRRATTLLPLFARHWHTIAMTLGRGEVYAPYLEEDAHGIARGQDWARGFMRAVAMRRNAWSELMDNEDEATAILPMMILSHEDDPNPALRPAPLTAEQREEVLQLMTAGLVRVYRYFRGRAAACAATAIAGPAAAPVAPAAGASCTCGSGRTFADCCGAASQPRVH